MTTQLSNSTAKVNNLRSGSVALAFIQAVAANTLILQQMIAHVYNTNRLGSSKGVDVDSYVADWGMKRLPAVSSSGLVTLTRQITTNELLVNLGGTVQTPVSQIQFTLIADTTGLNSWDPVRQVYYFPPGVNSIQVRVQAVLTGASGKVAQGTISQIVSGFQGVNSVTNASNFVNGEDQETDAALKIRFIDYIQSLASADWAAVASAITGVQPNLTYQIIEYKHFDGTAFPSGFTVVVDDGTGNASTSVTGAVQSAVEKVRAAGAQFEVQKPTNVAVNVSVSISTSTTGSLSAVQAAVAAALKTYINTLGVGNTCHYVNIGNVIQNVPGVFSYSGLTLNGVAADVTITQTQLAQVGTVTFS
jgi:uncharacterized phage protein gp47/JayE